MCFSYLNIDNSRKAYQFSIWKLAHVTVNQWQILKFVVFQLHNLNSGLSQNQINDLRWTRRKILSRLQWLLCYLSLGFILSFSLRQNLEKMKWTWLWGLLQLALVVLISYYMLWLSVVRHLVGLLTLTWTAYHAANVFQILHVVCTQLCPRMCTQ